MGKPPFVDHVPQETTGFPHLLSLPEVNYEPKNHATDSKARTPKHFTHRATRSDEVGRGEHFNHIGQNHLSGIRDSHTISKCQYVRIYLLYIYICVCMCIYK